MELPLGEYKIRGHFLMWARCCWILGHCPHRACSQHKEATSRIPIILGALLSLEMNPSCVCKIWGGSWEEVIFDLVFLGRGKDFNERSRET